MPADPGGSHRHRDLGDIVVHYWAYGSGIPIVVLHGWTVDHRFEANDYEPIFTGRDGWLRLYVDLPGHGLTASASWIADMDGMLDVVVRFISAAVPGQRFAVAGTSAGGYLAQGVAARLGNRMDGLILRVPLVEPDASRQRLPERTVLVERPKLRDHLGSDELSGFDLAVVQSEEFLAKMRADSFPARRMADFEFLDAIRYGPRGFAFGPEVVDQLHEPMPAPTLILTGRQDHVTGYQNAWSIVERYPRATFAVLDREGHILPVEQAVLFRALVGNWLDRVEGYRRRRPG
jgi:pimeloyl-ACP methyl ester carboxylesterase